MRIKPYLFLYTLTILLISSCGKGPDSDQGSVSGEPLQETSKSRLGYQSKQILLNGLRFHYVEEGEGDLMVFLHGFPYFGESWDKLLRPLSVDYHVVAPDNRGYAFTEKPEQVADYRIDKLVEDVRMLVTQLSSNKKAILVGHDWGGVLAWATAQKYPELVHKVIVINAPPYNVFLKMLSNSKSQQEASSYISRLDSWMSKIFFAIKGPELIWRGLKPMYSDGHINDHFKAAFWAAWSEPGAAEAAINWYKANIPEFSEIGDLTYWPDKNIQVEVPSLLIWSKDDKAFVTDTFEEIPKYVDDLEVRVIDTKSHSPFLTHTSLVLGYIQNFLDK